MDKIGIIGLGQMGQAMIAGFKKNHSGSRLIGYHYDQKKLTELKPKLGIELTNDYQGLLKQTTKIILAVRPVDVDDVVQKLDQFDLKGKILISIVSGLTIEKIKTKFHQPLIVVRALPNLNAQVGLSATGVAFDQLIRVEEKSTILQDLQNFGQTYEIGEDKFSVFTVVGGCTPAYFFKIVDAIYQSGVKNGLDDQMALALAQQSGYGSLTTLVSSELTPKALVDAVCVPGGITIEGIKHLDEKDFDKIINEAIEISIKKDLKGH